MLTNKFDDFLKNLAAFFKFTISSDDHKGFILTLNGGLKLQIEQDKQENVIIGIPLGLLQQGRYRENIFKEALRENHLDISSGVFGYLPKSQNLILFLMIENRFLDQAKIPLIFPPFLEKAKLWKDTIKNGEIPYVEELKSAVQPNLFGLIH